MAANLRRWLSSLDLAHLADAFEANEVGLQDLPLLSDDDLKELGVALGPRRRLMAAIGLLRKDGSGGEETTSARPAAAPDADRRQLTVMFCDLVESTRLSRELDPEDLRDLMRRYQDAVAGAITRYGGYLAKYLGDGVLAYFGWPQAYEDQAERALRAGQDAVAAVANVSNYDGTPLSARVGIDTGQVVVGDLVGEGGRDAEAVSGETPNLAARLQGLAAPGQVVIGDRTRRLVGHVFALEDLGRHELKGFDEPVRAWAVGGGPEVETRFDAAHGGPLTAIVGRDAELGLLLDRWRLAAEGEGQAVLISGEAGIGKSRLLEGLLEQIPDDELVSLRYQCSPYHTNSALYPTIRQLSIGAGFAAADSGEAKLGKLEGYLERCGGASPDEIRLLAQLLSLPFEERYGALELPPQRTKELLFETLIAHLLRRSGSGPVLFLCEDAHWIDPTSEELLHLSIGGIENARVLLVVTYRPEWHLPPTGHDHVTTLQLNRLGRAHSTGIVRAIAGSDASDDLVDRIISRTDGIPLYIEELTKAYARDEPEEGGGDIPESLQAWLLSRIDRLDPKAKEIAQIAAVIGREFSRDLLDAVADFPASELDASLAELIRAELAFHAGAPSEGRYYFRHALFQDAVYESTLKSRRHDLHVSIAGVLERDAADTSRVQPEVIAHHLVQGGQSRRSVPFWIAAAERALSTASYSEADSFVEQGLTAVAGGPDSPEAMSTTVDLLFLKYAARYHLGDPKTLLDTLSEAEAIVSGLDDPVRMSKVLTTQTYVLAAVGQLDAAVAMGNRNVAGLSRESDVNLFCHAKLMLGRALYGAGRYGEAVVHFAEAMERVGERSEYGRDLHGLSHAINSRAYLALCLSERGEFVEARRMCDDALRLVQGLKGSVHEHLWLKHAIGRLNLIEGKFGEAIETLEPVLSQIKSDYPVYFPRIAGTLGAAYAAAGAPGQALDVLRQADEQLSSTGFRFGYALVMTQHAEALKLAGHDALALAMAAKAVETAKGAGERGNEGWAACLLGEILAAEGGVDEATENFRHGLAIGESLEMAPLAARCRAGLDRAGG